MVILKSRIWVFFKQDIQQDVAPFYLDHRVEEEFVMLFGQFT